MRRSAVALVSRVTRPGVDRGDVFLAELDAGHRDVAVRRLKLLTGAVPEQDLQLGEPEQE